MSRRSGSKQSTARRLVYDIETAFRIGGFFGPTYDVNVAKVIGEGYVMGFAWKFVGDKRVQSCYIWDFPRYKRQPQNDIEVIKKWRELMTNTDIVIGHNSDQFDNKVMTARMLVHRLPPLSMPQLVDTKKMVKRVARFDSNKLDDLGEALGLGRKIHTNVELWWGCMQGNPKSQKQMVKYNKQDVTLTEKLYQTLMPYDIRHPNVANIEDRPDACPKCGVEGFMWAQGWRYTKTGRHQIFQCKSCSSKSTLRKAEKTDKPRFV